MMLQVKDNPTWFRDASGALVNSDTASYQAYLAKKNAAESKNQAQRSLEQEINIMKTKVDNIESTLQEIISLLKK